MLVFQRTMNETIHIGEAGQVLTGPIIVMVVEQRGNKTRLGVEAPREIPVHRGEVQDAINKQRQERAAELMAAAG